MIEKIPGALSALLENIRQLNESAKSLYRSKKYASSVHISILSIEESAKFLITFCRSYLPEQVFTRRFQHNNKYNVAMAPWYFEGQLSVVYALHIASQAFPQEDHFSDIVRKMSKFVSDLYYRNDPEALANAIIGSLYPEDKIMKEIIISGSIQTEIDRTSSVYVDISDEFEVTSSPKKFEKKHAQAYIDRAEYCSCVCHFVGTPSESIVDFVKMLPPRERVRMNREAKKIARGLVKLQKTKGSIGSSAWQIEK